MTEDGEKAESGRRRCRDGEQLAVRCV